MEDVTLHDPASPVYGELRSIDGITRISVPEDPVTKLTHTRRDRALLAADILQGVVDIHGWPIARVAEVLGASKRSTFAALRLSAAERDGVRRGDRPLFYHPTATAAKRMQQIVHEIGAGAALDMLAATTEKAA